MDAQEKTGFQRFRDTKKAKPIGIAMALILSTLFVSMGMVAGLDALIVAFFAYFVLRLFRVRDLRLLLLTAVLMLIIFTAVMSVLIDQGRVVFSKADPTVFDIAMTVFLTLVLPFLLLSMITWWMRKNIERTRARMEAEGRLYPPGYGRCRRCSSVVLPGEIICKRCGEYVDVPEEMRVKKVNCFECSECGREVPKDAGVCPYCGEAFEEDDGSKG